VKASAAERETEERERRAYHRHPRVRGLSWERTFCAVVCVGCGARVLGAYREGEGERAKELAAPREGFARERLGGEWPGRKSRRTRVKHVSFEA